MLINLVCAREGADADIRGNNVVEHKQQGADSASKLSKAELQDLFQQIYETEYGSVKRYALLLCKDRCEAEDIVQETFISLYNTMKTRSTLPTNIRAYLHVMIKNRWLDRMKKHRLPTIELNEALTGAVEETCELLPSSVVDSQSPEQVVETAELQSELQRAISALPETTRGAVSLHLRGYTAPEIATMYNQPLNSTKSTINRGMQKLRQSFQCELSEDKEL